MADQLVTCRDVSTLIATGQLEVQPLGRRLRVWLHAALCRHCRRFWRQVRRLDDGMRGTLAGFDADKPPDLEDRITSRLSDKE